MKPKFSIIERERLLKRVIIDKEPVAQVCRDVGISRALLYRWISRYQDKRDFSNLHKKTSVATNLEAAVSPKKGSVSKRPHFDTQKRIQAINQVLLKKRPVTQVCQEFNISKTIFYRWLKKYQMAGSDQTNITVKTKSRFSFGENFNESAAIAALEDTKPHLERYAGQVNQRYEQLILDAVAHYPELSSQKLVHMLPMIGTKPVVGNHGVENVLRRFGLTTYEKRLAYSISQSRTPFLFNKSIGAFISIFIKLFQLPLRSRNRLIAATVAFCIPFGTSVILLGVVNYIEMFKTAPSLGVNIGYVFSSLSLVFGCFFLLYSAKYYISVAIVLLFSRQQLRREGKEIYSQQGLSSTNGLLPDVSHIKLDRAPFVSIHLPLYNERRVVNRLLEAVTAIKYENFEVIVCDDSTDESKEIVNDWKNHPRIKISHRTSRDGYKGGALREALKLMDPRTEFVLVFDADFLPFPDSVEQFLKYFKAIVGTLDQEKYSKSKIAALQGYQWHVLNKSENWVTRGVRTEYAGSYVIERSSAEVYAGLKQISGSVYMIQAPILQKIGWGDSITEDFELTLRLYEAGYKVAYTPYIQAPSECVSTLKRLIRQRMRWAEGHSYNVKKYFRQMLFGKIDRLSDLSHLGTLKTGFVPSPLTLWEKLEFLYLTPYYLQSLFFVMGTFSWFIGEAVFQVRLPFWTEVWGWSLVLTNMLSLPLMNMVGMFLEEAEEKDYLGIFSFVVLTYIITPFQAYAAVKGFVETSEGPWFRTPKTGRITDIFAKGKFYRFLFGFFGRPETQTSSVKRLVHVSNNNLYFGDSRQRRDLSSFRPRQASGNFALSFLLIITMLLSSFAPFISVARPVMAAEAEFSTLDLAKQNQTVNLGASVEKKAMTEIRSPINQQVNLGDGKILEYIFHPDPRTRIKLGNKEVEMKLMDSPGLGQVRKAKATQNGNTYRYEGVYKDVDLVYQVQGTQLSEEVIMKRYHDIESIDSRVVPTQLVMTSYEGEIKFAATDNGGDPLFAFSKPYMYEQGNPSVRSEGLRFALEKEIVGYRVRKVLTEEGRKWLADPSRVFPVVIDPTMAQSSPITSGVTAAETNFGSFQRKIVYSDNSSAWYAFNADGGTINYRKCLASSGCNEDGDWGSSVQVSVDTSGQGVPSVWFQRAGTDDGKIFVAWIDDAKAVQSTLDSLAFRTVDTANSDTLGTQCNSADQGSITISSHYAYIAVGNNGDVLVGYTNSTGTDTESNIFEVPTGGCSYTSRETGSGLPTASVTFKVIPFEVATNRIVLIYTDVGGNGDLRESQFDISSSTWNFSDNDVDGSDNVNINFSAVSDGNDIWVLRINSSLLMTVDLLRCSSCTGDTAHSWTQTDEVPFPASINFVEVSISYIASSPSNQIVAFALKDVTTTQVYFSSSDADTISWSSATSLNFTANDGNDNLSSTFYVANDTEVGVVLLEEVVDGGTIAYSFSTLPENTYMLLLSIPLVPWCLGRLKKKKQRASIRY